METLSTHHHFIPAFGPEVFHKTHYEYSDKVQKKPLVERSVNLPEKVPPKTQIKEDKGLAATNKNHKGETTHKTIYTFPNEMSLDKGHAPQSCEPPKIASSPGLFPSDGFKVESNTASDHKFGEREFFMRCVMIGAKGTGKHELVSTMFAKDNSDLPHQTTGVNFVAKTSHNHQTTRKYHFWLNTLGEDDTVTKKVIWKTYYKYANAFVFVYDTTDKKSFEALEAAVKSVLEVVPQEQFTAILVGTKTDLDQQREVPYDEINNFRLKYNFKYFVETNSAQERESSLVIPRLNTKLKCTFEAI